MSSTLDKTLREKYGCRSIPVCKDDEVKVMTGKLKGREGRVVTVYRKRFHILVERLNRLKSDNRELVSVFPGCRGPARVCARARLGHYQSGHCMPEGWAGVGACGERLTSAGTLCSAFCSSRRGVSVRVAPALCKGGG